MPINNYIVATEPLTEAKHTVLTKDIAVADSKFVVNYFRMAHDKGYFLEGRKATDTNFHKISPLRYANQC